MAKMTNKEKVLDYHPCAVAKEWSHAWCIERMWPPMTGEQPIGEGTTAQGAWKNAAERLAI